MSFNPWRELRRRTHITLRWAHVHPSKGRIIDHGNGLRTIVIDPCLDQVQRNATLVHELVHDHHDLLWTPGTPPAIVAQGERLVRNEACDLLVDPWELAEFIEQVTTRGFDTGVAAADVASRFIVPVDVARLALERQPIGF